MKAVATKRYNDYSTYIRTTFGERVQKLSLDAGFTCPNRDGSKGFGGCTYCNNNSFNPSYCEPTKSVTQQFDEGIEVLSKRNKNQKFLAYFQAYSNTYGELQGLKKLYSEALDHPKIHGLVIGTRPDCVSDELLDHIEMLSKQKYVSLEYGIESTLNRTLGAINRGHTFEETQEAYKNADGRGFHLGGHMIIGLPGETREEILAHADRISQLPINSLKLHQLQIIKHTVMAVQLKRTPEMFNLFEMDEYIDLIIDFLERLRPDIVLERFVSESPASLLIAPKWGKKNFEMVAKLDARMVERNASQGRLYSPA